MDTKNTDLLWKNISSLPYFRGFLRAVEGRYYDEIELVDPILDLGIGDGHFSATTFPGKINIGIDPALNSLLEAESYSAAEMLICCTGDGLPFPDGSFRSVISNSVLEHINDLAPVLYEVKRVMKADGCFVICVPNDNFTQNLSIARLLGKLHMRKLKDFYQRFFNKISRHYHPDPVEMWKRNLEGAGFEIIRSWSYFPPKSLAILEWGHLFGIPAWINKQLFGEWILIKKMWNLWPIYHWLKKHYNRSQTATNGAYSFFIMRKGD